MQSIFPTVSVLTTVTFCLLLVVVVLLGEILCSLDEGKINAERERAIIFLRILSLRAANVRELRMVVIYGFFGRMFLRILDPFTPNSCHLFRCRSVASKEVVSSQTLKRFRMT